MYKLERILCPTDFSPGSVEAIRFAAFLSAHGGCQLTLLYVDEQENTPLWYFEKDEHSLNQHRELVSGFAHSKFSEIVKKEGLPSDRTTMLVRFGTAYHDIIEVAEDNRYSLVVIATEGLGRSSPHLIGRTAERVVRLCRGRCFVVAGGRLGSAGGVFWRVSSTCLGVHELPKGYYAPSRRGFPPRIPPVRPRRMIPPTSRR